jgi:hypothetical protein
VSDKDDAKANLKMQRFKIERLGEDTLLAMAQAPGCKCWDKLNYKNQEGADVKLDMELNFKGFLQSHRLALDAFDSAIAKLEEE